MRRLYIWNIVFVCLCSCILVCIARDESICKQKKQKKVSHQELFEDVFEQYYTVLDDLRGLDAIGRKAQDSLFDILSNGIKNTPQSIYALSSRELEVRKKELVIIKEHVHKAKQELLAVRDLICRA